MSGKTNCADITVAELAGVTSLSFIGFGSFSSLRGSSLKSGDFAGLTGLTNLNLSSNEITTLPADIFSGLSALTTLRLDDNQLSTLPSGVFAGLTSLTTLNLSNNPLPTSLPASLFADVPRNAITLPTGTTVDYIPTTVGSFADIDLVENDSPQTVDVADKFSDTDDTLTYTVESNNTATVTVAVSGSTVTITPVAIGTADITITATDTAGQTATQTLMVSVNAQDADPTDLCSRTAVVKNVIVSKVSGKTNCADITVAELAGVTSLSFIGFGSFSSLRGSSLKSGDFAGLTGLTNLNLSSNEITTLPADIFSGLSALTTLRLDDNQLSTLPSGVFAGLTSLTTLNLSNNSLPASLPASLFADVSRNAITLPTGTTINEIPTTVGSIPAQTTNLGTPLTVNVANKFSDTDDTLTYTVESNNTATVTVAVSGSAVTITPVAIGTADITITATDTAGQTATQTLMVSVNAQDADPTDLCSRTAVVKNVIVSKVSGKTNCADITVAELAGVTSLSFIGFGSFSSLRGSNLKSGDFAGLTGLTNLNLSSNEITTLPADIFSGLSALTTLRLDDNQLSTLPSGVFAGLTSLTTLNLSGNSLPASLPASLFADVPSTATITLPTGTTINAAVPTTVGSIPAQTTNLGVPLTVNVADKFSDPNDTLTYTVESNNTATATVEVSGSTVTITPVAIGTADITVTATDTAGQTATQTFMVSVNAQDADPTDLCSRTAVVKNLIISEVSGKTNCADITTAELADIRDLSFSSIPNSPFNLAGSNLKSGDFAGLTGLTELFFRFSQLTTIPADIFSGLSALERLFLNNNQLSSLPSGIFAGLTSLTTLNLSNNSLPASLPASLFADVPRNAITLPTGTTINAAVPTTVGSIPAQTTNLGVPLTVNVADKFSDTGDTLTYTVESNNTATATVAVSGSTVTITPVAIGTADITVTATDTADQTVTQTFTISITNTAPTDLCSRTAVVKNLIISEVSGKTNCADITTAELADIRDLSFSSIPNSPFNLAGSNLKSGDFAGLTGLTELFFRFSQLTTIPADIFSGLSALERLFLNNNQLSSLPSGIFAGLTSLTTLNLSNNSLPASLPASLFADVSRNAITLPTGTTINAAAPTTVGTIANITNLVENGSPQTVDVADKFSDTGDTLTYTVESNNTATATVAVSGSTITITPVAIGTATITITAADTAGQTATQTLMVSVNAQEADPTDLCSRSQGVRDEIVASVSGKTNCADITTSDLAGITTLQFAYFTLSGGRVRDNLKSGDFAGLTGLEDITLKEHQLTTLPADIFSGLSALTTLRLDNNQLSTLPSGIFSGLTSLTTLNLSGNSLPASLPASLFADVPRNAITLPAGTTINAAAPTTVGTIANITNLVANGSPQTVDVADKFSDTGDTLTYTVESNNAATATVEVSGSTITITPVAAGSATITITATDTADQTVTQTFMVSVNAQEADPTDLCSRTAVVKNVIVSKVSGKTNCADITVAELAGVTGLSFVGGSLNGSSLRGSNLKSGDFAGLTGLTDLRLRFNEITTLPADIFSGLSALTRLELGNNQLSTLPTGLFSGLTSLTTLNLSGNSLPASLPASLFADLPATATITFPTGTTINDIPTTVGTIANITDLVENGSPQTVDVADKFSDPNDTLTYTVESNNTATATVEVSGSTVTITPVAIGTATITITATDTAGQTATQTLMVSVNAQDADPTDLCSRTAVVKNVIVNEVSGKTDCADITTAELAGVTALSFFGSSPLSSLRGSNLKSGDFAGLTGLTRLDLDFNEITSLPADIFSGLSALTELRLDDNQLSTLPSGVFAGLTSLTTLNLSGNSLPASLPASLFADLPATATITLPTGTTINAAVPTTVGTIDNITDLVAMGSPRVVNIANKFSDTGDTLTYTVKSNNTATATVAVSGSTITITPVAIGTATITITATDTADQTVTQTFMVSVNAQEADPTDLCSRTAVVKNVIVNEVSGKTDCADITTAELAGVTALSFFGSSPLSSLRGSNLKSGDFAGLTGLTRLDLDFNEITSLPADIFSGLSALTELRLDDNQLSTLPSGVFAGLTSLTTLNLSGNSLPASLPASLFADVPQNAITLPTGTTINAAVPTTVGSIPAQTTNLGIPLTVNVADKFSDTGDTLTYTVESNNTATATVEVSGSTITITPVAIGTATITITAADTADQTATQTFAVTVVDTTPVAVPSISISPATVTATVGTAIANITIDSSGGAVDSYSISPTLTAGLTLDTATGTISGTPTATAPSRTYTITATNSAGSDTAMVNITVNAAPVVNNPAPTIADVLGNIDLAVNAQSHTLNVANKFSDPDDTLTFSVQSDNTATVSVAVSGSTVTITPIAIGTTTITVTAADTIAQTVTQTFMVTVISSPLPNPTVCMRHAKVQEVIIQNVHGKSACGDITAADLAGITSLVHFGGFDFVSPKRSDFAGLTALLNLDISDSNNFGGLTTLPADLFQGLPALRNLNLTNNQLRTLPIGIFEGLSLIGLTLGGNPWVSFPTNIFNEMASVSQTTRMSVMGLAPINAALPATNGTIPAQSLALTANPLTLEVAAFFSDPGDTLTYIATSATPAIASVAISGSTLTITPVALGTTNIMVTARDTAGQPVTQAFAVTVSGDAVPVAAPDISPSVPALIATQAVAITPITIDAAAGGAVDSYSISPDLPAGLFIDPSSGEISGTPTAVAGEQIYTITATNTTGTGTASVTITVNAAAVADTAPSFAQGASIADQTHTVNTMITALTLPEASGGNGALTYALTPDLPAGLSFNANTRTLAGTPTMAASMQTYTYTVMDSDANMAGGDANSLTFTITVNAAAVADTAPSFAQGANIADQTHTVNTTITTLTLPEASGGNGALTYALTPALPAGLSFAADARTISGIPTMAASMQTYTYTVMDSDANMAGGDANSLTFTITVNAAAVADTAPSFAQGANIANQTHTVNTTITTLTLPEASGGNGALTYALTPALPAGLGFNADARTISGTPTMAASMQTYTYTVMDSDANMAGGDANSLTFTITVNAAAVADTAPSFAQGANIADQTHTVNTTITTLTLPEASGGNGALTYTLTPALPAGLGFNADARTISGTPTMAASMQTYTYTVMDSDANMAGGDANSLTFTITVNAAAVADTAPSFAQGANIADQTHTVNTTITTLTLPEASGGNGALTYTLTPALPAGLGFNADARTISGTPTMAASMQTYTYTVMDSDANMAGGDANSLTFTITVNAAAVADTAPSFAQGANIADQTHTVNTTITTLTLPEASGGNGALTYTLTPALPAGLGFNADARTISGTPTMAASMQTYTYTVMDSDANMAGGDANSLTFTITVNAAAVADTAPSFAQGANIADQTHTVNTTITTLTLPEASGGNGALTYTLTPALPAGLGFNADARTISGTPTMAASMQTYTYTVMDSDANMAGGDANSLTFTITVNAAAVADTAPSFAQGASIADQTHTVNTMITALTLPEASGGNGALTYALTPALPAGLSFAADARTISGIPTMAASMQTYTYTVMDSDANMAGGDSASLMFTITVNAAPVAVPTATVSRTVTTSGKSILVGSKTITVESRTIQVEVTTGVGEATTITGFSAGEVLKEVLETIANKAIATGGIDFTKAPPSIDSTITPTLVVNTAVDISVNADACPAKGCEVTLSYEASDEQGGKDLYVFHYDGAQWEALPHVRRDTINRKVTALATRFSPFALFNVSRADKLAKQLNKDILPNLVQTMLASTMAAVSNRMDAAFSGRPQAASYQFDGQTVQLDSQTRLSSNLHNTVEQKLPTYIKALKDDTLDWKRLIGNSSFVMPLNALDEDGGAGATVWGSGEYINLSDKDWKGNVFNVQLGVDQRIKDDLLAGGLVSWSKGDVDYTLGRERGKYTHQVTSIHPYMARSHDGVNLWGSVGYGQGELSIAKKAKQGTNTKRSSGTRLLSLSAGISGRLTQYGQSGLKLKSDLSLARTNIDGSTDIPADKLSNQRLRLLLEIDKERPLASGGRFNPLVEIGLRYDGGTGESGIGAVLGLGGRYANATGLIVEGKFHTLVGRKDYKEWGVQGVIRQQSGANDQGLTFSLSPSYGATGNNANQVWEQELADGNNRNDDYRARLDVNMGYGLFTSGGLLTPYSELRMGDSNRYRLGLRWKPNSPFNLHLYGERKTSNDSDRVLLESHIRF